MQYTCISDIYLKLKENLYIEIEVKMKSYAHIIIVQIIGGHRICTIYLHNPPNLGDRLYSALT